MASKEGEGENPLLVYKLGKIEIKDDNFLGVDLSVEKKYLEGLMDSLGENMKDCAVSCYLSRRCFGICCETFVLTANTARKLLTVIDEQILENFFLMNGLARIGWCVNYLMKSKIANYCFKDGEAKKKTQITEIYWLNHSLLRSGEIKPVIESVSMCNCLHCDLSFQASK